MQRLSAPAWGSVPDFGLMWDKPSKFAWMWFQKVFLYLSSGDWRKLKSKALFGFKQCWPVFVKHLVWFSGHSSDGWLLVLRRCNGSGSQEAPFKTDYLYLQIKSFPSILLFFVFPFHFLPYNITLTRCDSKVNGDCSRLNLAKREKWVSFGEVSTGHYRCVILVYSRAPRDRHAVLSNNFVNV